jgi:hypothetical protein
MGVGYLEGRDIQRVGAHRCKTKLRVAAVDDFDPNRLDTSGIKRQSEQRLGFLGTWDRNPNLNISLLLDLGPAGDALQAVGIGLIGFDGASRNEN